MGRCREGEEGEEVHRDRQLEHKTEKHNRLKNSLHHLCNPTFKRGHCPLEVSE